jgi:hypothetical protein
MNAPAGQDAAQDNIFIAYLLLPHWEALVQFHFFFSSHTRSTMILSGHCRADQRTDGSVVFFYAERLQHIFSKDIQKRKCVIR